MKRKTLDEYSRPEMTRKLHTLLDQRYKARSDKWQTYQEIQIGCASDTMQRADFLAHNFSYKRFQVDCVEVKSCREDFKADTKWEGYLPWVTRLYFCCPEGAIDPQELPYAVGLLVWRGGDSLIRVDTPAINHGRYGYQNQEQGLLLSLLFRGN